MPNGGEKKGFRSKGSRLRHFEENLSKKLKAPLELLPLTPIDTSCQITPNTTIVSSNKRKQNH